MIKLMEFMGWRQRPGCVTLDNCRRPTRLLTVGVVVALVVILVLIGHYI